VRVAAWDQRIARARQLAQTNPAATELLTFYAKIAAFQQDVYRQLGDGLTDVALCLPALLVLVKCEGPQQLAEAAARYSEPEPEGFFTRALQQPHMEFLAARSGFEVMAMRGSCPFCQSKPVVAVLRGEGDGGKRSLICSLCSLEWEFRRILCPNCGEEDREKLPVFSAAEFDYIRIEACDTCGTYIKGVDLTKNGLAVPVVDEIASVALDIWAEEQGYEKLQRNLLAF
jgi:FdhE protein